MPAKNISKEVRYLNKDFQTFRNDLIEFAKIYFPNTYNDFNESSPGMMFIEMASYVGDVLSYYIDNQFKESMLAYSEERTSIFKIAQSLGYKPRLSAPASAVIDVFQTVPATGTGVNVKPDLDYGLKIPEGMLVQGSSTGVTFRTTEDITFKYSGSFSPMTVEIFDYAAGLPTTYLLQKSVRVVSGNVTSETFVFASAEQYDRIILGNENVLEVISVTDSDNNKWYEVPFLAQDTIYADVENSAKEDTDLAQYGSDVPYLLKLVKTPRRFTTYTRGDNRTELRFGAGTSANADEEIIPNPTEVGSNLPGSPTKLNEFFDPTNFLKTEAYGQSPSNTTLTVKYSYGGGVEDNVAQGDIVNVTSISYDIDEDGLDTTKVQTVKDSVGVTNPIPATGGRGIETNIEIRTNALAYFQAQGRAVTKEDYILRAYTLPAKYGNIAKVYFVPDEQLEFSTVNVGGKNRAVTQEDMGKPLGQITTRIPNPLALNMYVIGYDSSTKLTRLNTAVKENLRNYINQFRMITDSINIKDAWIINVGVKFTAMVMRGYNKHEVILKCINEVKNYFDIEKRQINQPIMVAEIANRLYQVEGVASIVPPVDDNPNSLPVIITNKWKKADGYSGNMYDMESATKNGVIYPSMDPSIFEIKYPNNDIEGRAIGDADVTPR
jgi:hypothetical protein